MNKTNPCIRGSLVSTPNNCKILERKYTMSPCKRDGIRILGRTSFQFFYVDIQDMFKRNMKCSTGKSTILWSPLPHCILSPQYCNYLPSPQKSCIHLCSCHLESIRIVGQRSIWQNSNQPTSPKKKSIRFKKENKYIRYMASDSI